MSRVSCIIPAYNEGLRIKKILSCVYNHPLINEIIVVDDGSTDDTQKIVKEFRDIKLVRYPKNKGKSYAVMRGIKLSKYKILLLLDADLNGLNKKEVSDLLNPVLNNRAEATISLRSNTFLIFKLLGIDPLSGERVFHKKLIKNYKRLKYIPCFGLEVFINENILKEKVKLKIIRWNKIKDTRKYKKFGLLRGTLGDIKTVWDIFKTVGSFYWIYQTLKMKSLIKYN
jgi:glycosyltransferase involved in cell wall biosynthesis